MRADWIPDRLPEDLDAERGFLSTACAPGAGPACHEAVASLGDEDFVHPRHRAIFRALRVLLAEGTEIHGLTLKDALDRTGELERAGGFTGLTEVLMADDMGNPGFLAEIIARKAKLRRLVHAGAELTRAAATEEDTPEALIAMASTRLADLTSARAGKGLRPMGAIGEGAWDRLEGAWEGRGVPGVTTGLPRLDRMLKGGFKPGQLIVLAARPGVGKSTLAREWARRCASMVTTAALFSLEMGADEVWEALACNLSGIDSGRLAAGDLSHAERARVQIAREDLAGLPLLVDDQAEITIPEIRGRVDRAKAKYGRLGMVLVDYLQLISSPKGARSEKQNEATRIGEISRGLKLMAKDAGMPVVVLSQLNREIEKRSGGRPQLSDLRDSGAIEQDADVVIFLHRKGQDEGATYELIVAKNRSGKTGTVHLQADLSTYSFHEMDRQTEAPILQRAACSDGAWA